MKSKFTYYILFMFCILSNTKSYGSNWLPKIFNTKEDRKKNIPESPQEKFFRHVKQNQPDEVSKILASKDHNGAPLVNPNEQEKEFGTTALIHATVTNNTKMMQILLKNGASLNAQNAKGETALKLAIKLNKPEALAILLKYKANIQDALHWAIYYKDPRMVKALLLHGANPSQDLPLVKESDPSPNDIIAIMLRFKQESYNALKTSEKVYTPEQTQLVQAFKEYKNGKPEQLSTILFEDLQQQLNKHGIAKFSLDIERMLNLNHIPELLFCLAKSHRDRALYKAAVEFYDSGSFEFYIDRLTIEKYNPNLA